jgi:hypothetical protein
MCHFIGFVLILKVKKKTNEANDYLTLFIVLSNLFFYSLSVDLNAVCSRSAAVKMEGVFWTTFKRELRRGATCEPRVSERKWCHHWLTKPSRNCWNHRISESQQSSPLGLDSVWAVKKRWNKSGDCTQRDNPAGTGEALPESCSFVVQWKKRR